MRARRFAAAGAAALCLLAARPLAAQTEPDQTKVTLVPAAPAAGDLVTVVVESDWPDGCTPGFTELRVEPTTTGLRYVVTLTGGPDRNQGCPAAVTHFKVEAPLGRVLPGTHEVVVEGRLRTVPDFLIEFGRVTFTVGGGAATELELHGGRFRVQVSWTDFAGGTGAGSVVPGAGREAGLFWFFAPDNWELLIKVLDACSLNGRWWVLGAAATNVRYTITVHDTVADETWSYENPLGTRSPAILDTDAFDTCP